MRSASFRTPMVLDSSCSRTGARAARVSAKWLVNAGAARVSAKWLVNAGAARVGTKWLVGAGAHARWLVHARWLAARPPS